MKVITKWVLFLLRGKNKGSYLLGGVALKLPSEKHLFEMGRKLQATAKIRLIFPKLALD